MSWRIEDKIHDLMKTKVTREDATQIMLSIEPGKEKEIMVLLDKMLMQKDRYYKATNKMRIYNNTMEIGNFYGKITDYYASNKIKIKIIEKNEMLNAIRFTIKLGEGVLISQIRESIEDLKEILNVNNIEMKIDTQNQCIYLIVYNNENQEINFSECFENSNIEKDNKRLDTLIGKDVNGSNAIFSLDRNSCVLMYSENIKQINTMFDNIIVSLLLTQDYQKLNFLIFDSNGDLKEKYKRLPQLLSPIYTKENVWSDLVRELDDVEKEFNRRCDLFVEKHVRSIKEYNENNDEKLSQLVIFINDLSSIKIPNIKRENLQKRFYKLITLAKIAGIFFVIGTTNLNDTYTLINSKSVMIFKMNNREKYTYLLNKDIECDLKEDEIILRNFFNEFVKIKYSKMSNEEIKNIVKPFEGFYHGNDRLLKLLKETNMNESTIEGVNTLVNTDERQDKVIHYIKRYKDIITDHQLRQYITKLILKID